MDRSLTIRVFVLASPESEGPPLATPGRARANLPKSRGEGLTRSRPLGNRPVAETVTLTYDWSAVPPEVREYLPFPPAGPPRRLAAAPVPPRRRVDQLIRDRDGGVRARRASRHDLFLVSPDRRALERGRDRLELGLRHARRGEERARLDPGRRHLPSRSLTSSSRTSWCVSGATGNVRASELSRSRSENRGSSSAMAARSVPVKASMLPRKGSVAGGLDTREEYANPRVARGGPRSHPEDRTYGRVSEGGLVPSPHAPAAGRFDVAA